MSDRVPSGPFHLFGGGLLRAYLEENTREIVDAIDRMSEDYILGVSETELINHLYEEFIVGTIEIQPDDVIAEKFDKVLHGIPSSRTVTAVRFFLPYSGNANLLLFKPSSFLNWTTEVNLKDACIQYEVYGQPFTSEHVKKESDTVLRNLAHNLSEINKQVEQHNSEIRELIEDTFKAAKQKILDDNDIIASLGVPIRKKNNLPKTYAIPTPQTIKKIHPAPVVTEKGFTPEWTLDDVTYQEILKVFFDLGRTFETHPSTYSDKDEEALRDLILLYLAPRYEGSATGETFNKKGKTDILLQYEKKNVFVAECMFWAGQKSYLKKISQLLRYLTWRDSKAALVVFVNNKEITPVLETVENNTSEHENFLGFVSRQEEGWFNFRIHLNGDKNREVHLAVLVIHIPPV